jgi:hypothetical protein
MVDQMCFLMLDGQYPQMEQFISPNHKMAIDEINVRV